MIFGPGGAHPDPNDLVGDNSRFQALCQHMRWTSKIPTPFISLSSTSEGIWRVYEKMVKNEHDTDNLFLSVVDADALCQSGTPLIKAMDEMIWYGVKDPYDKEYEYYKDEVLALFAIPGQYVVKTQPWNIVQSVVKCNGDILQMWDQVEKAAQDLSADQVFKNDREDWANR